MTKEKATSPEYRRKQDGKEKGNFLWVMDDMRWLKIRTLPLSELGNKITKDDIGWATLNYGNNVHKILKLKQSNIWYI